MKPPSDDELILHYYGESNRPEEIDAALGDPEVAARWRRLRDVLDAVPREVETPARPEGYGAEVWRRIQRQLPERSAGGGRLLRFPAGQGDIWRWAAAAGVALLVGASFWIGSLWRGSPPAVTAAEEGKGAPRVLLLAVSDHLDRTEMLLAELVNRGAGEGDVSVEREWAEELTTASRFYRQAAERSGAPEVAWFLSQLEPVLVELSHAPEELTDGELADLRSRLERGDMLFKIRVVGSRLKHETTTGARGGADV
jgi:hypothetical protein